MTADQATQLAKTILNIGEGRDAAVFITALGMAAASAITYGINDKTKRQQARDFFIDEFTNACKKLDKGHTAMITTCWKCHQETNHKHWHDTAHGIAETHMAGSERWTCDNCGYSTYAIDNPKNPDLIFVLDVN